MLRKMTPDTLGKDMSKNLEGSRITQLTEIDLLTVKLCILFIIFILFGDMKNIQLIFIKHRAVSKKLKLSKLFDQKKRGTLS